MTSFAMVHDAAARGPADVPAAPARWRAEATAGLRTAFTVLHRWMGLTFGLVLAFMAVTGALIAYRPHVEPLLSREVSSVPACTDRAPLDLLIANARDAHPAGALDYVRIAAAAPGAGRTPSVQVRLSDPDFQDDVFVHPCTGAVLGQRARYGSLLGFIEKLHRFRFMEGGSLIAGTTAFVFVLALAGGGLYLAWPSNRRAWRASTRFNPRLSGRARTINRHKMIGLYASVVVLASALTGLPQSFDWYRKGLYALAGSAPSEPRAQAAARPGAVPLPMEVLWQRTQDLVPAPREALLHFPSRPREPVEIFAIAQDAPHANARTMLSLDPYDGKALRFTPYAASSPGHKLYFWTLSWHTGEVGGLLGPLVLLFGALSVPVLAYTGTASFVRRKLSPHLATRRLTVRVARKRVEARDICTFELAHPLGKPLPAFSAGSHIDVFVRDGLIRQYSLCNDPRDTHRYLIGVLRAPGSRGGSAAMHEDVQEGDLIEIGAPRNHFSLAHGAGRSILFAGGIGVTPILCMAERLANSGAEFEMHYCTRSPDRTAFMDRIQASGFADRVSFHFDDGPPAQKMNAAAVLAGASPGSHLYVCGPQGFMDAVIGAARAAGWPEARIHREYFSAAAGAAGDGRARVADRPFDVKIASTGRLIHVPAGETVVAALARRGVHIPTSCSQGLCGTCLTRVIAGEPEHRDKVQSDAERACNDQFTPCCSRSRSPLLVLDL